MALSTANIDTILKRNDVTKGTFLGTYPACMQPISKKKTYAFVTNTDDHTSGGTHWNAWYVESGYLSFFDSFGRSWDDADFPMYYRDLGAQFRDIEHSQVQIQGFDSWTCGHFCINYIYTLCLGMNYQDFLDNYSRDYVKNDLFVLNFINSII